MRSRLFLKIYATLLASLVAVAIASAIFFGISERERDSGWSGRRDHFISALLPAGADTATLQATLDRLGRAFDADISVFEPDGKLIASTGRPFQRDILDGSHRGDGLRHGFVTTLDDGRLVAARTDAVPGPGGRNPLAYLVMIAAVIGLAAYPVVRHLTRRLEQLRKGVEAWGAGALDTRVPEKGTDEVATVAKTFNEAADRVERLVSAHRSLLANASHELRSPIARLRMAIDLHEKQGDEGTRQEIILNLTEVDRLVEEILLASRLDHVGLAGSEPIDLLGLTAGEAARNELQVSGAPAYVLGDPPLMIRLIRNLIQNALNHGKPPIDIEVRGNGTNVELRVRDHGAGIAPDQMEKIFEPFYRPPGSSEASGGWGLGLSLVRQIAGHHGGWVKVDAPEGGGARFIVSLPATRVA